MTAMEFFWMQAAFMNKGSWGMIAAWQIAEENECHGSLVTAA